MDADGRQVGGSQTFQYDAAGQMTLLTAGGTLEHTVTQMVWAKKIKRTSRNRAEDTDPWSSPESSYFIRSMALGGQIVSETTGTGGKQRTNVYAGGRELARQNVAPSTGTQTVEWQHYDPSGSSMRATLHNAGSVTSAEMDALGNDIGLTAPLAVPAPPKIGNSPSDPVPMWSVPDYNMSCEWDGMPLECGALANLMRNGADGRQHHPSGRISKLEDRPLGTNTMDHILGISAASKLAHSLTGGHPGLASMMLAGMASAWENDNPHKYLNMDKRGGNYYSLAIGFVISSFQMAHAQQQPRTGSLRPLTEDERAKVDVASGIAKKLLETAACRAAVSGSAAVDPTSMLDALQEQNRFDYNPSEKAVASTPVPFNRATTKMSLHPSFFGGPETRFFFRPDGKIGQLESDDYGRALTVLHELKHIFKNGEHPEGNRFPFDIAILKGCFGIDSGYPKGYNASSTNISSGVH